MHSIIYLHCIEYLLIQLNLILTLILLKELQNQRLALHQLLYLEQLVPRLIEI